MLKNLNKETRAAHVDADKSAHEKQLEKEKEIAREKGEWRQKQRLEEEQRKAADAAKKTTAAAAPATVEAKKTTTPAAATATATSAEKRPENTYKSGEANEIYHGAACLWGNGKGRAGDVAKLAASTMDHAEQLEIGKFIKDVVALYS